jgi:hypothetical protein
VIPEGHSIYQHCFCEQDCIATYRLSQPVLWHSPKS